MLVVDGWFRIEGEKRISKFCCELDLPNIDIENMYVVSCTMRDMSFALSLSGSSPLFTLTSLGTWVHLAAAPTMAEQLELSNFTRERSSDIASDSRASVAKRKW